MPESFAERWRRKEAASAYARLGTGFVACGTAVLPTESAPCLTFDRAASPVPVGELFGEPRDWSPADRERVAAYRVIGSDGAGNPLCLEQPSGAVWLLDHEDRFRTRQFVNAGADPLAECLLAYMGESQRWRFRAAVRAVDPAALAGRSFWWEAVDKLNAGAEPGAAGDS